jgi:hypothetical protein
MAYVWALAFIGIPTVVCLMLTSFLNKKIHLGFLFRWFTASACALVMLTGDLFPMAFISDDEDSRDATPSEEHVSDWICFPIESPTVIMFYPLSVITDPHHLNIPSAVENGALATAVLFFFGPAVIWGLILERLLVAKRRQRLILLFGIVLWAIWFVATSPIKTMSESATWFVITWKWAILMTLILLLAGPWKIGSTLTRHADSRQRVP